MSNNDTNKPQRVTVVDFDVAFGSLIWLMVKIVLASIPALVLVILIFAVLGSFLGGLIGRPSISLP